ncbi:hypothetical protein JCM4814A_80170 [Streptomyces phaeofaciens JCM 4814]|uniref:Transposase n=1 Tax=Streptomyces phaeofaciens TaxID=68254 RepID=A0A918HQ61_9ACTN|nr:hypothetical protein GCM10010226_82010 [Streptomyces phaeofaciens]
MPSWRVHGQYVRRLGDAPVTGSPVVIELTVRRFKCLSSWCPAVTFAEQIEGLTRPHARQTQVLRSILASIAFCLAGRPGARLAAALAIRIAKDALLDLLRSVPQPPVGAVRFLGWTISLCTRAPPTRRSWLIWKPAVRSMFCPAGTPSRWLLGCDDTRRWR